MPTKRKTVTFPRLSLTRRSVAASRRVASLAAWRPARAQIASTRVTFVLTNDIYLMGDQLFPDGKRRGGFARLAAVVKAERAKGGHVIFAHGGDTLSPSLMSGFDRGAHIIALTNMIRPDIFVAGNHEFDFGKAVFPAAHGGGRHSRSTAPICATTTARHCRRHATARSFTLDGVRIGLMGLAFDKSPRVSSPEDLKFRPTIEIAKEQAAALRAEGADFIVGVMHAERGDSLALQFSRTADLLLTGHTHDLFVNFDGQNAIVELGLRRALRHRHRHRHPRQPSGRPSADVWWPQFRVIDTADVVPDPEVAAVVQRYEAELLARDGCADRQHGVELDSRNATVRTREAAIGNLFTDAMRARHPLRCGDHQWRRHPRRQGLSGRIDACRKDILAELPFNNRVVVVELSGAELLAAIENGLSALPQSNGRFPQVAGLKIDYESRGRPASASSPSRSPACRSTRTNTTASPSWISSPAAATITPCCATPAASPPTTTRRCWRPKSSPIWSASAPSPPASRTASWRGRVAGPS